LFLNGHLRSFGYSYSFGFNPFIIIECSFQGVCCWHDEVLPVFMAADGQVEEKNFYFLVNVLFNGDNVRVHRKPGRWKWLSESQNHRI